MTLRSSSRRCAHILVWICCGVQDRIPASTKRTRSISPTRSCTEAAGDKCFASSSIRPLASGYGDTIGLRPTRESAKIARDDSSFDHAAVSRYSSRGKAKDRCATRGSRRCATQCTRDWSKAPDRFGKTHLLKMGGLQLLDRLGRRVVLSNGSSRGRLCNRTVTHLQNYRHLPHQSQDLPSGS